MHDDRTSVSRPGAIPWPPILLVVIVVCAAVLGRLMPLPWPGVDDTASRLVGFAILIGGFGLLAWAAVTLARHRTTILPHAGATRLVTAGPYHWRRNPIYLADVMILAGLGEPTKNIWFVVGAAVFAALVTWLQILPEERHLEATFGAEWTRYAERTRRWI